MYISCLKNSDQLAVFWQRTTDSTAENYLQFSAVMFDSSCNIVWCVWTATSLTGITKDGIYKAYVERVVLTWIQYWNRSS